MHMYHVGWGAGAGWTLQMRMHVKSRLMALVHSNINNILQDQRDMMESINRSINQSINWRVRGCMSDLP